MTGGDKEKPSLGALRHSRFCATKGCEETPCREALGPPGTAPARLGTVTPLSCPQHPPTSQWPQGSAGTSPWGALVRNGPGGSFMFPGTEGFSEEFRFCICLGVSELCAIMASKFLL